MFGVRAEAIKRSFVPPAKVVSMESKKVLVLGAGYVAPSCVECLAREDGLGMFFWTQLHRTCSLVFVLTAKITVVTKY